ncbi:MAG: hypothetical protein H6Q53_597 [Deltaproteobacteria bacterium]|nr:hypothetical protein [Deltaproteobacteria bacterium]
MNKSAVRKFAAAPSVKDSKMRVPMGVLYIVFWTVLVFANLPGIAFAESLCPGIHVKVLNIRNSTGNVACALFESSVGFPEEYLSFATNIVVIRVRHREARCDFADIAPGTYALAVVHDENMNGKLDTNWLGIPTEGYGFSNDATALLGSPSFSAASFLYNGQNLDLTVSLHY